MNGSEIERISNEEAVESNGRESDNMSRHGVTLPPPPLGLQGLLADAPPLRRRDAWVALLVFFLCVNGASGFYWIADREVPAAAVALGRLLGIQLSWYWIVAECRPHRVSLPMCMGILLVTANIVVVPYALWKAQGWKGLGKIALVIVMWAVTYLGAIALAWLITRLN